MFLLLFLMVMAHGASFEHLQGLPPERVELKIQIDGQPRALEVQGTLKPAQLIINGKEWPLEKKTRGQTSEATGFYIDNKKISTSGSLGRFYSRIDGARLSKKMTLRLVGKRFVYQARVGGQPAFFENQKTISQIAKKNKIPTHLLWKGKLEPQTRVFLQDQVLVADEKGFISLPFSTQKSRGALSLKIEGPGGTRLIDLPYQVEKQTSGKGDFFFSLALSSRRGDQLGQPWDLPADGDEVDGVTLPQAKVQLGSETVIANADGEFSLPVVLSCDRSGGQELPFLVHFSGQTRSVTKSFVSRECERYQKKSNSRFFLGLGFGHWAVIDSPAEGIHTMSSDYPSPGPRLSLGVRLYRKLYLEIRGQRMEALKSFDSRHRLSNFGYNSFWLAYPYRGEFFAAVGMVTFRPDYSRSNDPNFFGFENQWTASLAVEAGYRIPLSPSWSYSLRLVAAPKFLSLQNEAERQWPFFLFEPIAFEYHFL